MLVETVHVQLAHGRINDSVYLKNRIFTFRVAKKLGKKIQKGMLFFSKNGQLVYVKNIITGKSEKKMNILQQLVKFLMPHQVFFL